MGGGAFNGGWGGGPSSPGGVGSGGGPGAGGNNTVGGTPGSNGTDGVLIDFYGSGGQTRDPNPPFIGSGGTPGDNGGNGSGRTVINSTTIVHNYNTGGGINGNAGNGGNGGNGGEGGEGENGNGVSDAWAILAFKNSFEAWGRGDGSSSGEIGFGGGIGGVGESLFSGFGGKLGDLGGAASTASGIVIPFATLDSSLSDYAWNLADSAFDFSRDLVRNLALAIASILFLLSAIRIVGGLL